MKKFSLVSGAWMPAAIVAMCGTFAVGSLLMFAGCGAEPAPTPAPKPAAAKPAAKAQDPKPTPATTTTSVHATTTAVAPAPATTGAAAPAPATTVATPSEKPVPAPLIAPMITPKEKASYALGVNIGKYVKLLGIDVDMSILQRGVKDAMAGEKLALTDEEMMAALKTVDQEVQEKQMQRIKEMAEKNKAEGEKFLAENKKKEGVVTLPSGLQYKEIKAGDGKTPTANDTVSVNYTGTFVDGVTEFDSSYKRGEPAKLRVGHVVPGLKEALLLMKVGSTWMVCIPANLAYGEMGAHDEMGRPTIIGPNATLVFKIELLGIEAPEAPAKAPPEK